MSNELKRVGLTANPINHDLRPVLRCISQSSSARETLESICRIAVQQCGLIRARIGRYDQWHGQAPWIAEVIGQPNTKQAEAAQFPILSNGSPWGVFCTTWLRDEMLSDEDSEYLKDICLLVGMAIDSRQIVDDHSSARPGDFISQAAASLADQHSLRTRNEPDQAKAEFLAAVAHELRSPLTPVIGFAGMMLQKIPGPLTPEQQHQLEMIRTSGRRLLDLIKNILDLAKLALGQTAIHAGQFDLNETVRAVASRAEPMATEKGIALHYELPQSPTLLVSDRRLIGQLVSEILENAIQFTDRGRVTLTASTLRGTVEGEPDDVSPADHACIQITDTGIGIAASAMPRLFTAFGHAGHGKTHHNEGSRLGLAICKGLIDLLRGRIHVDSDPNIGSIVTIYLPTHWQGQVS